MSLKPEHSLIDALERRRRKVRIGIVVSNKMQKTLVVRVRRHVRHSRYPRVLERATCFKVHDEKNEASVGDWVKIMETRPISKNKRWRLVEIVRRVSTAMPFVDMSLEVLKQPPRESLESSEALGSALQTPAAVGAESIEQDSK